jgi:hypothetical protein
MTLPVLRIPSAPASATREGRATLKRVAGFLRSSVLCGAWLAGFLTPPIRFVHPSYALADSNRTTSADAPRSSKSEGLERRVATGPRARPALGASLSQRNPVLLF